MATHHRVVRTGAILSAFGAIVLVLVLVLPVTPAAGDAPFQGDCIGSVVAGSCVLDEPEGRDPAVHGTVLYLLTGSQLAFTILTPERVTDVQICAQLSGPFAQQANACAGSHGNHVSFARDGESYVVDLAANGFPDPAAVYWTLHVVAGGRTLQVRGPGRLVPPTTTTSPTTTSTTTPPQPTTTGTPATTTTVPGSTTSSAVVTTTSTTGSTTTTSTVTTAPTTTTTGAVGGTSEAKPGAEVLGEQFGRTGGRLWGLVAGAVLLSVGITLVLAVTALGTRR